MSSESMREEALQFEEDQPAASPAVAVIGMSGKFPGATNISEYWQNLLAGRDTITRFTRDQMESRDQASLEFGPDYIPAHGVLENAEMFDAEFFSLPPREADYMDPQHRLFLEACWNALEDGGYAVENPPGQVGVFGGCGLNTYLLANLCRDRNFLDQITAQYEIGEFNVIFGNDKDFLCTRVAYKLNLRGPAVTVQAACATSLVAICQAAQSLLTHQCDMALAGGVSVTFPQHRGYTYQEGSIGSDDGHCRPFDANATGTVFGHGVGVVLLKRLENALEDGDRIDAVIRGWAINNDGGAKVSYMAPGVDGQADLIAEAHAMAGINASEVQYVEAHGTATPLGDPVEVAALTRAFRQTTDARNFCALGSVKANIGHLSSAAGVSGFIKTVLALRNGVIPPLTNFTQPNKHIDLADTPFYFPQQKQSWQSAGARIAGVSAFGVGGVNAHIVLEEAPQIDAEIKSSPASQLIPVSARSKTALASSLTALADHLERNPDLSLTDVSYTLRHGRKAFAFRTCIAVETAAQATAKLRSAATATEQGREALEGARAAFLFPGQGSQFAGMCAGPYRSHPVFARELDHCISILNPILDFDLRTVLLGSNSPDLAAKIQQTSLAQPALFVTEWAMARLWQSWGITPGAMAGHSLGEYVAATLAGVFNLDDALRLVALRGRLAQSMQPGSMLSVRLGEQEALAAITNEPQVELAAINSPALSVVAGPTEAIERLASRFEQQGVAARPLYTSHAFHSAMMDPMLEEFGVAVSRVKLHAPQLPFVSTMTGQWITAEECTSPAYWVQHCRKPVRFADAASILAAMPHIALLEVGPGQALTTLALQQNIKGLQAIASLPRDKSSSEDATMFDAAGRAWQAGLSLDWSAFDEPGRRHRIALPTYPFQRKRHWVEPPEAMPAVPQATEQATQYNNELPQNTFPRGGNTMTSIETRATKLESAIAELFEELSGITVDADAYESLFLDLGFDSLLLTQVTQSVQRRFAVKVTFRQLLEDYSSVRALAARIDQQLPAETAVESATAPPQVQSQPQSLPAAAGSMESIFRAQTEALSQLFQQQMAALSGLSPSAGTAAVTAPSTTAPLKIAAPVPPAPVAPTPAPQGEAKRAHGPFRPVQAGSRDGLTDKDRSFIAALIERYTRRTPSSKQYTQKNRAHLADPRAVSGFRAVWKEMVYPIVTRRSRGSRLWDIDDNEYIDIVNGFGAILLGHSPDFVTEAVREQIEAGVEIGPQSPLAGEVAERICKLTGMERVAFCNTGSEAVMAAMRVARTVTARDTVVYFTGDYHGTFDEVLLRATPRGAAPIAPGILAGSPGSVVILEYGTDSSLDYLRTNIESIAAVMVEPIQSRHPELQPAAFLKEVRKITEAGGSALIFDEVVTGFRLTQGGAQNFFGVRADLATYGKVIGGGYPIGVLAGRGLYLDALDGGQWSFGDDSAPEAGMTFFAGTFVRHPLAMAAARAVLNHLEAEGPALQERLAARVAKAAREIETGFRNLGIDATFPACATWFIPHLPSDARFGSLLYYLMRERGVHVLESYPCFFTTAHSDADFERVVQVFLEAAKEMADAGMFPIAESLSAITIPGASAESAPLTEPQQEILLAAMKGDAANCAFNESVTLWLQGAANETALCSAIEAAIDRHEVLRSHVDMLQERLVFHAHGSVRVPCIDLSSNGRERSLLLLEDEVAEDARRPFNLTTGPLVRAKLFRISPDECAFLLTGHHLALDGWSTNQLLSDVAEIYSAHQQSRAPKLDPVLPFSQYAIEQRTRQAKGEFRENEDYWCDIYKDRQCVLDLPTDHPRPGTKGYSGATCNMLLDTDVTAKLRIAATRMGSTVYVTMLSAFQILLHRLTGQSQVVVGISTAGQSLIEDQSLVGHCVNFLPILSLVDPSETAIAHTRKARAALLDAYDHQEFTYGTLLRKLKVAYDPSRLPLIEVQFNVEKLGESMRFEGLASRIQSNPKAFVNTDLFLNAIEGKETIELTCDFNTDLFDESTVSRWLTSFSTILTEFSVDAEKQVMQLSLLSASERSKIIEDWNHTEAHFAPFQSVTDQLEQRAQQTPDRIAAVSSGEEWSYSKLNDYACRLASYLHGQGIGAGNLVGVCLHRGLPMLGAVLGVMKSGAAYLPLDPTHPANRLELILEDAGASVLLTENSVVPELQGKTPLFVLDGAGECHLRKESGKNPPVTLRSTDAAYVIYTSGSTGKPKGVVISHGALYNFLCSMAQVPGITADDTFLSVTTISFDIAALELFLPLCTGARVVIARREQVIDGFQLFDLVRATNATIMQATPSGWQLLLEAGWEGQPALKVLCGGEAFPRKLADTLLQYGSEVWNMYGPTETTIWSSATRLYPSSSAVPIGPPIANTQFYILDESQQPVLPGVMGELFIGGDGLAEGYWNRPELTAEKFLPNPFHRGRMYRTGDVARWLPDGHIEILGRSDFQIKIRGYRIEIGEIENTLARHPAVREAIVTASAGNDGEKRLDGWIELQSNTVAANVETELRELMQISLPEYMRPVTITRIDAFPRTANGKIDRKALLERPRAATTQFSSLTPENESTADKPVETHIPETGVQQQLASIFAEVLGVTRVGIKENIFELGADSLSILRIATRASKAGLSVGPAQIFRSRTILELSQIIAEPEGEKVAAAISHATPATFTPEALRPVSRDKYRRA